MRGRVTALFLVAGVAGLVVLAGCDSNDESEPPSDPLSQAEIAFEGNPTRAEIQAALDEALELYELPVTEENYSRSASSLVALRKETGVPEMETLRAAIRLHTPAVNLELPDAFGLAAAEIQATK